MKSYTLAIRNLWHCNSQLEDGMCPACIVKHKVRAVPKIIVRNGIDLKNSQYGPYGLHHPIMSLLWRKTIGITNLEMYEGNLYVQMNRARMVVPRSDLIDPIILDTYRVGQKLSKDQVIGWIRQILEDQLEFTRHLDLAEHGEQVSLIRLKQQED